MERLKLAGIPGTNVEVRVFDENDNEVPPRIMGID